MGNNIGQLTIHTKDAKAMPAKDLVPVQFYVTPDQFEMIKELVNLSDARSRSDYLINLIAQDADVKDREWPDDKRAWGVRKTDES